MRDQQPRHRRLHLVRGTRASTAAEAAELVAALLPEEVLWVGDDPPEGVSPSSRRAVRDALGMSYDAVVLDLHDGRDCSPGRGAQRRARGLDANLVGQSHGFVRGGGAMILRLERPGVGAIGGRHRFAAFPYQPDDVTNRFAERFERIVSRHASRPVPLQPLSRVTEGTDEQAAAAEAIAGLVHNTDPQRVALLADRGRGKSSALGLAMRRAREQSPDLRVVVAAASEDAVREIFRFAVGQPEPSDHGWIRYCSVADLAQTPLEVDAVIVDESAQVPVPLLRRIARNHAPAHQVFATTTHGYEGTGRGFSLRFLEWLRQRASVTEFTLEQPIRWAAGDPLERAIFDALLLDADLVDLGGSSLEPSAVEHRMLDRDELVADEQLLRQFFGLLVQAHYRTTPGDLHRMLDAPNLDLHALLHDGDVVGASLVAREGGWTDELCASVWEGDQRVRGHALPETLVAHLGYRDAGKLDMVRSVRIAVHPAVRRHRLGTTLVEAVESCYRPDLFGTLFGATPGLLEFRRSCGYRVVRLSASRGVRTGEPSVAMVKPATAEGAHLAETLRADFARDVPLQLEMWRRSGELVLDERLAAALVEGLDTPAEISAEWVEATVNHYVDGPRTFESAALALRRYVETNEDLLDQIDPKHRALLEARVIDLRSWAESAEAAQFVSVPAAMRAMRRAVRELESRVADRGVGAAKSDR